MTRSRFIKADPYIGVVETTPMERALGRFSLVPVQTPPAGTSVSDLAGDLFFAMFKPAPVLLPEAPAERKVNHALMKWVMSAPNFNKSHASMMANLPAALTGAGVMYECVITDEAVKEALAKQQEAARLRDRARRKLWAAIKAKKKGQDKRFEELVEQYSKDQKASDQMAEEATQSIEDLSEHPLAQGMVAAAMDRAAEAAGEVSETMRGWGLDPGSMGVVDVSEAMKMMSNNSEKLNDIARRIGRALQLAASTLEAERKGYHGSVSDPTYTRDLMRTFPSERAYLSPLAPPFLRMTKIASWVSHGLLGWKPKQEAKHSGSFVAMVDGSGSMDGERELVAKAVALGIGRALSADPQERRTYEMITFGMKNDKLVKVTSEDDWKAHMEWAEKMPGGGTDFDYAFDVGIRALRDRHKEGSTGDDLLFITDGEARLSDHMRSNWLRLRQDTGARLFYIDICGRPNGAIKKLADLYVQITPDQADKSMDKLVVGIVESIAHREES